MIFQNRYFSSLHIRSCFNAFAIIPILCLLSYSIVAQVDKVDSLTLVIESDSLEDSIRIKTSLELVDLIYYKDFPKSKQILTSLDEIIST